MGSVINWGRFSSRFSDRRTWIDAMTSLGMLCKFDDVHECNSATMDWHDAGQAIIGKIELEWQSLSPITYRSSSWNGDHLFMKLVERGSFTIEQNGQSHRLGEGSIVFVDPLFGFNDHYRESSSLTILRIPKSTLRDRGLRYSLQNLYVPDLATPDVKAVRDFVLSVSRQAGAISGPLRGRLGDLCLELLDVLLSDRTNSLRGRIDAAIVSRAKQAIAHRLCDRVLSVSVIASELRVSPSSLTRAFSACGLSPMRYAWTLRLERAARILASLPTGAIQAQEVAYRCGFSSAAHFSRAFKDRYGMPPRAFALGHNATGSDAVHVNSIEGEKFDLAGEDFLEEQWANSVGCRHDDC